MFMSLSFVACLNFLKLCKIKFYNFSLFHFIQVSIQYLPVWKFCIVQPRSRLCNFDAPHIFYSSPRSLVKFNSSEAKTRTDNFIFASNIGGNFCCC